MFFFKLAFLNLLRRYTRTLLSTVAIVIGVLVIILGRGAIDGLRESIIRGQIDAATGHVTALPVDYPTAGLTHPLTNLLQLDGPTETWLNARTTSWTRRLLFAPRVVRGMDAMRARAIAFDPATDQQVFPRNAWRVRGTIPQNADDGVLLSRGIARTLALAPGDTLILETRTVAGAINALETRVAGIVATGNPATDGNVLFVPLPLAENLVRADGRFSHLAARLPHRSDAPEFAADLLAYLGTGIRTVTWETEAAPVLEAQDLRQAFLDIIALALLTMAAAGIANTVLMAAYERFREIGTLRALGLTRRGVMGLFVAEGALMGALGSLLGALAGIGLTWKYATTGIDLSVFIEKQIHSDMFQDMPMSTMLYFSFSIKTILGAALLGIAVALAASLYPAIVASRKNPAKAMRT